MKGIRKTDKNTRRFITISDMYIWDKIDKLMTLPKYEKSFNKVINRALFLGLPMVYNAEFGIATENEKPKPQSQPIEIDLVGDNFLKLVRLLKEVIINQNINKSILCSLFQVEEIELEVTAIGEQFSTGYYQDTPDFLYDYEVQSFRKLRDKEDA